MPDKVTAICPGTFDPVTVGHLDIIRRGACKFQSVVVGLIETPLRKQVLFTAKERQAFLEEALEDAKNRFGSREKLIASVLEAEKRTKDAGYKARLEGYPLPRLLDLHASATKRASRAPKAAAPKKKKKASKKKAAQAAQA